MKQQTIIIGSGAAAVECVDAMRANGFSGTIHVFSDTEAPPYNPMLTTYYVSGKIPYEAMFPYGSQKDFWQVRGAVFHPCDPVERLDTANRRVTVRSGDTYLFDQCLIASGASPFVPPIPGRDTNGVYTMRTLADAVRLKEAADQNPKRVVVVGASMVGVKVAELFHRLGADVCLADLADHIFPLAAHPDCATKIEARLKEKGLRLRFGAGLSEVAATDNGLSVFFGKDTAPETADLAVICIGVRPNLSFIDRSQIETEQGVLVDEHMETNVPGIYAAGDVAQGYNVLSGKKQIIGLWASARSQGRTAGRNMAGKNDVYRGNILHNITHFMGMDFVGLGDVQDYDRMDAHQEESGTVSMLFWKDGRLCGVNSVDRFLSAGALKNAMMKGLEEEKAAIGRPPATAHEYLTRNLLNEVKKQ